MVELRSECLRNVGPGAGFPDTSGPPKGIYPAKPVRGRNPLGDRPREILPRTGFAGEIPLGGAHVPGGPALDTSFAGEKAPAAEPTGHKILIISRSTFSRQVRVKTNICR